MFLQDLTLLSYKGHLATRTNTINLMLTSILSNDKVQCKSLSFSVRSLSSQTFMGMFDMDEKPNSSDPVLLKQVNKIFQTPILCTKVFFFLLSFYDHKCPSKAAWNRLG